MKRLLCLVWTVGLLACATPPAGPTPAQRPVVALLTDFGLHDDAVGLMRGVILERAPDVQLVDLCHQVPRFDVEEGSRLLAAGPGCYPRGTVFCVVVDPGVGTTRRAIVARLGNGSFVVAPDNGVLTDAAAEWGVDEVRVVENQSYCRQALSATFHGRDVFAPVAGNLAAGRSFAGVGPVVTDWIRLKREPARREQDALVGRVTTIDEPFGNVWTDLPPAWLKGLGVDVGQTVQVELGGTLTLQVPYVATFGDVPQGQPLLYMNSRGMLALALNMDDFARSHGVERGASVRITVP